jgi:3-hydroxyacyl-CoA dehydrogenase / enoyl-CoA hydratase / 3-hydroxybutyryl-CoA epimerase
MEKMVEQLGREGRDAGGGFYDYPANSPKHLWDGLARHFPISDQPISTADVGDRLIFVMALEAARCREEGVIGSEREADVASVLGIGFPAELGGAIRFARSYPGGLGSFVVRAAELRTRYGDRFDVPQSLMPAGQLESGSRREQR